MKRFLLLLNLIICTNTFFAQTTDDPLDILFVGNSLTYFNNMPQTFEQIADEQGYQVTVDQHTPGGTGFVHHVNNNALYQKFRDRTWDYVILQPGSNESPGFSFPIAETIERGKRLRDSILKYSPCASIYYYEISYGIVNATPESFTQYQNRQTLIKDNLIQMGNETDIPFVPVGECFKASMETDASQFLWVNYGDIHPNAKGSYMAACSFYNGIFKQAIVNTNQLGGLSEADANYLRNQAELTTLGSLDTSLIDTFTSTANFEYAVDSPSSILFTNTSSNSDSVHWDFGDGTTSTSNVVSHEFDFSANQTYTVVLTSYKNCKEHHKIIVVSENLLLIEDVQSIDNNVFLYPNPTQSIVYVNLPKSTQIQQVKLYDNLGREIRSKNYEFQNSKHSINLNNLPSGIYILMMNSEAKNYQFRVVKKN
ncbi:T9SS type A sorting domain-containing protein [Kordia sp.]|uniref:T9SS type A sorting domain-containing protein n=1 Tax=Kordia sp. TaxID=1965332 RepID=UPI003D6C49E7